MWTNDARIAYRALSGIFVAYKPSNINFLQARFTIIFNLCKDLNEMHVRPPMTNVSIEGPTNRPMKVVVQKSYADDPLVVGPRYQQQDFRLGSMTIMKKDTCGVMVCGINCGNSMINKIRNNRSTRTYRVKGVLGIATNTLFNTGRIIERSVYRHVTRGSLDRLCSSMQSSHQRKMFELCGVDIQSQAAYELAIKGPVRPADSNIPMIYVIKCVDFKPPEFTIEIVCINEHEMYLKTLIHEIGIQLHTNATCSQILCIQDGVFNITHTLLKKHWTLKHILSNMKICQRLLDENPDLLHQNSPVLVNRDDAAADVHVTQIAS